MRCPNCGNDVKPGARFCTKCGAPLNAPSAPIPPAPTNQAPPPPPGIPPPAPGGAGKRKAVIIIAILVGLIVLAGAAAGITIWLTSGGNKLQAEITGVTLELSDGSRADLDDVPIDEGLVLEVACRADYGEEGEAELTVTIKDGGGEELSGETYEVEAGGEEQVFTDEFYIIRSDGETFTVEAELEVTGGGESLSDSGSLDFYVAEGVGAEVELEMAKEEAEKKLDEATEALADIATLDIETLDLAELLVGAYDGLETADTQEEVTSIYLVGETVISECAARKAAYEAQLEEERRNQEEAARQADIAACKQAMFDYAWQTMTQAEPIRIDNFSMNAARTEASGTMVGMVTVHTDPDNAGDIIMVPIRAEKQGGQWVAYFI